MYISKQKRTTMRKLLICAVCVLLSLSARAGFIDGIRISGYDKPFIVTIDNEDVSLPATSCFVAGLSSGYYTIEVYESRSMFDDDIWKGRLLYSKRVYYNGIGIMDIRIGGDSCAGSGNNGLWSSVSGKNVMSADVFADFYQRMKDEAFSDGKNKIIRTAIASTAFTTDQCARLMDLYSFDDDKVEFLKLVYPNVVDKEAFFRAIDKLTFLSSRDKIRDFIQAYGNH